MSVPIVCEDPEIMSNQELTELLSRLSAYEKEQSQTGHVVSLYNRNLGPVYILMTESDLQEKLKKGSDQVEPVLESLSQQDLEKLRDKAYRN